MVAVYQRMPAVLTPTATQVVVAGGHTVRCATAVFDRLLLGQHWAARPPTRTAKNVRERNPSIVSAHPMDLDTRLGLCWCTMRALPTAAVEGAGARDS